MKNTRGWHISQNMSLYFHSGGKYVIFVEFDNSSVLKFVNSYSSPDRSLDRRYFIALYCPFIVHCIAASWVWSLHYNDFRLFCLERNNYTLVAWSNLENDALS